MEETAGPSAPLFSAALIHRLLPQMFILVLKADLRLFHVSRAL